MCVSWCVGVHVCVHVCLYACIHVHIYISTYMYMIYKQISYPPQLFVFILGSMFKCHKAA